MDVDVITENVRASGQNENVRPTCPGCDREILWVDEQHPFCACGCLLFWPAPERL